MPAISRLTGADGTNLLNIGRPSQADVSYANTVWTVWRAANPTATPAQVETVIQNAIAVAWPGAPVQIAIHVFDLITPTIGVLVLNLGETIPAQWWVHP